MCELLPLLFSPLHPNRTEKSLTIFELSNHIFLLEKVSTFCAQRRNFPLRFHFSFYYVVVFGCHFFIFVINCFVFTHSTRLQQTKNQIQKINCWFIASVWFNILFATFCSSFLRKLANAHEFRIESQFSSFIPIVE